MALALAFAALATAWGPDGHEITAAIAASLHPEVEKKVQMILGESSDDASTWADEIKHEKIWSWSEPIHFVDVPDGACNFDYGRDCVNDKCVVGAILNFTNQVSGKT